MKRTLILSLFVFTGIMACTLPGMYTPTPIPTFDVNQIPTMVVQTAQALAALSEAAANAGVLTDMPAPTPTVTVMLLPTLIPAPAFTPPEAGGATPLPTLATLADTPTQAICPETNVPYEQRVIELINAERVKAGLIALTQQSQLTAAATLHSADMACNNYFSHIAIDGSNLAERITRQGYISHFIGENLAAGYLNPDDVVIEWMNSPDHRANILGGDYIEIGVGYAYNAGSDHGAYLTAIFGSP